MSTKLSDLVAYACIGFFLLVGMAFAFRAGATTQNGLAPPPAFYVLDGFGEVHSGNFAPAVSSTPFGVDIARDIEIVSVITCTGANGLVETRVGVWVLDGFGGVHASDHAPAGAVPTPYVGFDIARNLELVGPPVRVDGC